MHIMNLTNEPELTAEEIFHGAIKTIACAISGVAAVVGAVAWLTLVF
jgi:hypothetical protein